MKDIWIAIVFDPSPTGGCQILGVYDDPQKGINRFMRSVPDGVNPAEVFVEHPEPDVYNMIKLDGFRLGQVFRVDMNSDLNVEL